MEHGNSILICPVCQHKNDAHALRCAQCGASLVPNTTTIHVSDEAIEKAVGVRPVSREMIGEGVVFYIAGEVQPLIVRGRSEIILGRKVEGQASDVVDMTPYHGHLLGVSRRHARLTISSEGALIEDLGSTNGTWLNEKRLTPDASFVVTSGDQIRLGQLILFVYFSSGSTRQKITLKPSLAALAVIEPPPSMALYLARQAVAYLEALIGIQEVIDRVQARSQTRAVISSIAVHGEPAGVEVAAEGLIDAVKLVEEVIVPWQKLHASLLATWWTGGRLPGPPVLSSAPPLPRTAEVLVETAPPVVSMSLDTARLGSRPAGAPAAPPAPALEPTVPPAQQTIELEPQEAGPQTAPAQDTGTLPGTAAESPAAESMADSGQTPVPGAQETPAAEPSPADQPSPATPEVKATQEDQHQKVWEEALQALLAEMLNAIKSGLLGVESDDASYLQQLRPPVEALVLNALEVVKSSY